MGIKDYYIQNGKLSYELDGEHTDVDLTKAEMELIYSHLSGVRNAVHLCCGAGRHVSAFGNLGIFSVGVDVSPYLVAEGSKNIRRLNLNGCCRLVFGEVTATPIMSQSTDCVTLLGNSFTFFSEKEGITLLGEVRRILRPNGIFILDIPHPRYMEVNLAQGREISKRVKCKGFGEVNLAWVRKLDGERQTLISQETLTFMGENGCRQVKNLTFRFHLYDPRKTCAMASTAGLRLINQAECHDASGRYQGMLKSRIFLILKAQA